MHSDQEKKNLNLNRRSFLKGALATGALAASGAALTACAPTGNSSSSKSTSTSSSTSAPSGYLCQEDWLGKKPEISSSDITETHSFDVVICGSGNAGIQAALAAAEEGASVAVIEKGTTAEGKDYPHVYGQEVGHFNSQWLINHGFGPYDLGEITAEFCRRGGNRVSPEIIKLYVDNCGEMFDNFISLIPSDNHMLSMGPKGELGIHVAYGHLTGADYPIVQAGYKTWAGDAMFWGPYHDEPAEGVGMYSNLSEAQSFSLKKAQKQGAQWFYKTTATILTQNDEGTVTGVIAQTSDGKYVKYEAKKGVILACGDMGQNSQMIWQLITEVPEWCARQGVEKDSLSTFTMNDGSGLKMGCWAGGYIEPGPRPTMSMGGGGGGPWGTSPFLWLNAEGKRYMNEGITVGAFAASIRQPLGVIATVTDSKWMTTVQNASVDHGAPNYTRPQYYEDLVTDMAKVVEGGAQGGIVRSCTISERMPSQVYGANDLKTALHYAGYSDAAIKTALKEIEHYNELCTAGKDSDFGKDALHMVAINEPPYFVAPSDNKGTGSAGLVTLTGLMTNDKLVVIKPDYTEVKNLYAVGNCLGQRYGNAYSTPSAGVSIGMAMTYGRIAGKNAAKS